MKKTGMLLLLLCGCLQGMLAQFSVSGTVTEKSSGQPVEMATIQLLKSDSTFVTGVNSDKNGKFSLSSKSAGKYIVKTTFIGYSPTYRNVSLTQQSPKVALGNVALTSSDVVLKGATVSAAAAKVSMRADTFVYNAAAYKVPVGSTLETLVSKLPGAEVSDDGSVTINGKSVKQILINGKDFFKSDASVALKNLPTELVKDIKAYDKKSDYSKQTGVDDGEEQTVLDVGLKKELKENWIANIDLSAGTRDRYAENIFVNRYTDRSRISLFGNANNTGDRGFRGGFRGGASGLSSTKSLGMDFNWSNGKNENEDGRFEIGGNVRYSHTNSDSKSKTNSETFLTGTSQSSSFSNSWRNSKNYNTNVNAEFRLEWHPDTLTTLMLSPEFSHSETSSWSKSRSATFNDDPYAIDGMKSPLDSMFQDNISTQLAGIAVNRNLREQISDGKTNSVGSWFMAVRRLNAMGRNVALHMDVNYSKSSSHSFSISDINYYNRTSAQGNTFSYQYNNDPSKSFSLSSRLSYSEPLTKNLHLQVGYRFKYSYSNRDRQLYELDSLDGWKDYSHALGQLPSTDDSLQMALSQRNSQYATYRDYDHNASIGLRYNTKALQMNASVDFRPQTTRMSYQRDKIDTLVTRNVFNVAPNVRLRWKISQTSQLDFRYRGSSSQPSMTDLLDVTDDSDPLNITKGNPGLKPSWKNSFNLFYNNYIVDKQMGWMVNMDFSQTSNSISSAMTYDEQTGVRTTQPKNINGNWDYNARLMFNTPIDAQKRLTINTFTNFSFSNDVTYVRTSNDQSSEKNTTKTTNVGESLRGTYRNDWLEFGINGNINYQHSRNKLQSNADLDTYTFRYGWNTNIQLPWNMQISTDMTMSSRRGYQDNSMNTNELLWNAQIAQSFLKGNAASVSLQFYDILHKQSNVSRTINAQMRSDSWTNAINSYVMVHFIYRLNIFGGSSNGQGGGNDRDRGGRGMRMMGGGGPGGGPGGFGGRR